MNKINLNGFNFPYLKAIIGVHGKAYSGKDMFGSLVKDQLIRHGIPKEDIILVALADELKCDLAEFTDLPIRYFYGDYKEQLRPLMQAYADIKKNPEFGGHDEYWVDRMLGELPKNTKYVIITDIRYEYETKFIRSAECKNMIVHIEAIDPTKTSNSTHHSESGIAVDYNDWQIYNDHAKGIGELSHQVKLFVNRSGLIDFGE